MGPEEIRQALETAVTVVRPGESLVVLVPFDTPAAQIRDYQHALDEMREWSAWKTPILVLAGEAMATVAAHVRSTT